MSKLNYRKFTFCEWWGKGIFIICANGLGVIRITQENNSNEIWIDSLNVYKSARNKGIAEKLLSIAEKKAKEYGADCVYIQAKKGSWMIDWYIRRGYEILPDYYSCNSCMRVLKKVTGKLISS